MSARPTAKARLADAKRRRDAVRELLDELTDEALAEVLRRGQMKPRDGYPSSTLGGSGRGTSEHTPTEAAALAGLAVADDDAIRNGEEVRSDQWDRHDSPHDPIGDAAANLMRALLEMHARAITAERAVKYVINAGDRRRKYQLGGDCRCCGREVQGGTADPVRSGYCATCGKRWERAGRPDRGAWEREQRAEAQTLEATG
jgi:hypothetical protein